MLSEIIDTKIIIFHIKRGKFSAKNKENKISELHHTANGIPCR
jgi:hypothetical protein